MRTKIVFFWLFIPCSTLFHLFAQSNFDCDQIFIQYYNQTPEYAIQDKAQFCVGVKKANHQSNLNLQKTIKKETLSPCHQNVYEEHQITIICIGETDDSAILDQLVGYNMVMKKRIQETWGFNEQTLLAQVNPLDFGPQDMFTDHFYDHFNQNMIREVVKTKKKGKQLKLLLKDAYLFPEYFADIPVVDRRTQFEFTFKDFFHGITLPIDPTDQSDQNKLFNFILTDFDHPNYCRTKDAPTSFIIWLTLKETFK